MILGLSWKDTHLHLALLDYKKIMIKKYRNGSFIIFHRGFGLRFGWILGKRIFFS